MLPFDFRTLITTSKESEMTELKNAIKLILKNNAIFVVALFAATITSFIVPPDREYLGYFDLKTLACLFSVLAVVSALRNIHFFEMLASSVVKVFGTARSAVLALVYITFIGSMLIANDMALITFLPLGFFILTSTGNEKYMAFVFIMQNIAANLGGMLTPFGNPQNLYLYTKYNIPNGEFISIMLLPFMISVVLITVCCIIFVKKEKLTIAKREYPKPDAKRTAAYLLLFAIAIIMVFRVLPYYIGMAVVFVSLLFLDRRALRAVDYALLFTFVCFFIFSGNMSRMEPVRAFFASFLEKSTLIFSTLSCQFISNVPTAILLSQFTENYRELLVGVNIGGTGTLIASLASLITFREYVKHNPDKKGKYVALFSAFNFSFLAILLCVMYFVK